VAPPDDDRGLFYLNLDLGQVNDFSALVALRQEWDGRTRRYTVRGAKRWPRGYAYSRVVADVVGLVAESPLAGCVLGVDQTGVGRPIFEMLAEARPDAELRPIVITGGLSVTFGDGTTRVPKVLLCGTTQALLQGDRLVIPEELREAATLKSELQNFRARVNPRTGHESLEADWRTQAHDDLILSLAIAAWLGETTPPPDDGDGPEILVDGFGGARTIRETRWGLTGTGSFRRP
jgi:hypothetical protein